MDFKNISIRGRMAYLLCTFESILNFYNCEKEKWCWILEKLWQYTSMEYLDDWMYMMAEYMPESILEDKMEDIEFITENEIKELKILYTNCSKEINKMLRIVFELGTIDLYSKLLNYSPNTLEKLKEGMDIAIRICGKLPDKSEFEKYKYTEGNGWGIPFDGKKFSLYLLN